MKPLGKMKAGELAAYVATHLKARGISVEQSVLVAQRNTVDLEEIREWSRREGHSEKFGRIRRRLKPAHH